MRRALALIALALCIGVVAPVPSSQAAATCRTSGPSGGGYTVTVCVGGDLDAGPLTGPVDVPITVDTTPAKTVTQVVASLSGEYLITDFEGPWFFRLPTARWVDGSYRLQVQAIVRGSVDWTSAKTIVPLVLDNGVTSPPVNSSTFDPPSGTKPARGDPFVLAAVGDGAAGTADQQSVVDEIASWNPNLFLYLGDVYRDGTGTEFFNWYGKGNRFGTFRPITAPTIGNHEYQTDGAAGYFDYWDNAPHYYSFDVNGWHVISLDTNTPFGQLGTSSAQYRWLQQDLQSSRATCTLAFFHQPRFSVGLYAPGFSTLQPLWALLANNGVDLVINGHDHNYQRWRPLNASGASDPGGTRELIVGTGGHESYAIHSSDGRLAKGLDYVDGALRLELGQRGARFDFIDTAGTTLDGGSFQCSSVPDSSPPSKPQNLRAAAIGPRRVDLDWSASSDDVGVAGYTIYRNGNQIDTVGGTQTGYSDTSVVPTTAYTYRVDAFDEAGNHSARSDPADVTTPDEDTTPPTVPNVTAAVTGLFSAELSWTASTDSQSGVAGYDVYRDGVKIGSTSVAVRTFTDSLAEPNATYQYGVRARDNRGNVSAAGTDPATMPTMRFFDGFESGGLGAWDYSSGLQVQEAVVLHGTRAVRAVGTGAGTFATASLGTQSSDLYGRVAFRIASKGDNGVDLLRFRNGSGKGIVTFGVNAANVVTVYDDRSQTTIPSVRTVSNGVWHELEAHVHLAGPQSHIAVWLDGVKIDKLSLTRALGTVAISRVQIGDARDGRTYDVYLDDALVDDGFIQ